MVASGLSQQNERASMQISSLVLDTKLKTSAFCICSLHLYIFRPRLTLGQPPSKTALDGVNFENRRHSWLFRLAKSSSIGISSTNCTTVLR